MVRLTTTLDAERHLRQSCRVMAELIGRHGHCKLTKRQPFHTLVNSIISQQLSSKAADTIKRRVEASVPGLTPAGFLEASDDTLRAAGLSSAKARYIVELARRVSDGRLNLTALNRLSDAEVILALVELPGIGRWTAEMFLIFGLGRLNVLSLGDAGLQRSARLLFGDDVKLQHLEHSWQPYCSVASWYLWRHLDA